MARPGKGLAGPRLGRIPYFLTGRAGTAYHDWIVTTFERRFLWPVLGAWCALAAFLILGIAADALLPPPFRPLRRLLHFRDNLRAPEWVAAERAHAQLSPCPRVVVDTDNAVFFYNLRYMSYPTWVLRAPEKSSVSSADSLTCRVSYRDPVLRIRGARAR